MPASPPGGQAHIPPRHRGEAARPAGQLSEPEQAPLQCLGHKPPQGRPPSGFGKPNLCHCPVMETPLPSNPTCCRQFLTQVHHQIPDLRVPGLVTGKFNTEDPATLKVRDARGWRCEYSSAQPSYAGYERRLSSSFRPSGFPAPR